ncbi:MAG: ATP-binding protein, partial [Candidatus Izemoplasmatales bacterium]|nr:ATP-binding protein [Candidatus Izemoplasmatales bacterium]
LVMVISSAVVGVALLLPEAFDISTTAKTIIAIIASIFIVLILDPLKRGIAKVTDKLFFKASVDYQTLLADLSQIINKEIDMDRLLYLMAKKIEKEIKLKNVSIYLAGSIGGAFYKRKGRVDKDGKKKTLGNTHEMNDSDEHDFSSRISHNNPLVEHLKESQEIIVLEALERKIEDTQDEKYRQKLELSKKSLDDLDAGVVAPVNVGNKLNAIMVFGPKLSGDPFGSEDIELFKLIGPQLSSALEKSRLYEEAKQFSERLKKEVTLATEHLQSTNVQLQERNRFLSALQKVTTLMTQTLDFKKVTQSIADSISTELGYLGGIVMFLGKDRHKLFPDAVTQTPVIKQALKLLPKSYSEFYGDFLKDKSSSITAIKEGKVQIGHDLYDFIGPAIPKLVSKAIQKLVGVKTIVAVPIFSESKVIGVIDFLLKDEANDIKETDLSMMNALANQTGIVSRNIELYSQVQASNTELAEANVHLQQLDSAKSEFVSITSHQLRTPMTGIMGYLSMILQGDFGKVPKEQNKILTELLEESQRMIRIINLFLNVSKIESGKMQLNFEEVQIEDVVERVIDMVQQPADDKGLKLIYKKSAKPLPKVWGDKDKLGDIVLNFTDNAIKYTEKGTVTLITEVTGDYMHFAVKDSGRGIDPEEAKKLFTKFVRGFGIAQVNPDGSGLGLYVARRLTEAHHGEIWVESEGVGKGSTFQVKIPLFNGQKVEEPKK